MRPGRADLIGSLLTRPERKSVVNPTRGPQTETAISRRLKFARQGPVDMLTSRLKEQEAAASSMSLQVPGGDAYDRGSEGGVDSSGPMGEAEFNRRLQRMMKDAPGGVSITSGKRDPEKQKQLWAQALKKYGDPEIADNWVARPGTSKHESGLAADLKFANDAVKKWYQQNAAKYGLYFPMGNEPWHIQYDPKYAAPQQQQATRPTGRGGKPGTFTGSGDPNLDFIIQNESGWRVDAKNPNSSAFGLGQLIKANREAYGKRLGYDPNTTDLFQQLHMMKEYVKERYGSTAAAAAFKRKHGWY